MKENKEVIEPTEDDENLIDKELDSILENVPKEGRHEVKKMIGMSMQMGGIISPQMELMKKMTPEHVSEFLDTQKMTMQNQFKENRENKIFLFSVLTIVLIFIVVLIVLLKDKPEIMEKVLYALGGLITGILGGYGLGKSKSNEW